MSQIQTKGKGRENTPWFSDEGGLYFSITLKPDRPEYLEKLALIGATSIVETLELDYLLKNCRIKLPNDVYSSEKKIAGVLVDGQVKGRETTAYLGIGTNLNNDPRGREEIREIATSYYIETGKKIALLEFLVSFLQRLDVNYSKLASLYQ